MPAPKVSVIIPTYNQSAYLKDALASALSQTYRDYEVVVVNDGSTDDTEAVVQRIGGDVRYIFQQNQGLAGARNTGIRAAQGEYIALLDSDDIWDATFLERMMALAQRAPGASVLYCGICYIDAHKHDLPQRGGTKAYPEGQLYQTLLRANFLIPSTVVMKRNAVMAAGLFDPAFRRLQDRELWIRMLRRGEQFAGLDEALVRYRVHGSNLSTDAEGGRSAIAAMARKHFGEDDGSYEAWSADKRLAYGGYYRYCLLSAVQLQEDWDAGARYFRQALRADPTLARDADLFYSLAVGSQPVGYRGTAERLDLLAAARGLEFLLEKTFQPPVDAETAAARAGVSANAFQALALVAYNTGQYALSRKFALRAARCNPRAGLNRLVAGNFLKSFIKPLIGRGAAA